MRPVLLLWLSLACAASGADAITGVSAYNVVWDSPSRDSSGSMPLGNGDVGINAWVEPSGDLVFYISKTDAWSENARLLKLGRVRIASSPAFVAGDAPFRQELRLEQGEIAVESGRPGAHTRIVLWVDANHPTIHVGFDSDTPRTLRVDLEDWRTGERELQGREIDSAYGLGGGPKPVVVYPDTILTDQPDRIVWFHRNRSSIWPLTLRLQELGKFVNDAADPLMNRTFGAAVEASGLTSVSSTRLESRDAASRHNILITVHTSRAATAGQWLAELNRARQGAKATPPEDLREAHHRWWREFWARSWIRAAGNPQAESASRGYTLQRFLNACAGRGAYPIKFNGSIFTVDARESGETYDADYRRWGGPYWFQNTRLAYWPMLAAGDFDLMQPLFRMYRDALPLAAARTPVYFGHRGAFFPETMYFWGAYANTNYGWNRAGKPASFVENTYIRYYWQGGLELITMMLDYLDHTSDEAFSKSTLLPLADAIVEFYDLHYSRDANGKILFKPAAALETWHEAVNPLPEIAGLRAILPRLGTLSLATASQRARWARLFRELPPVPTARRDYGQVLIAAEQLIGPIKNVENPELYAVFPYRLFGVGKPDLEMARRSFEHRRQKGSHGWFPDAILAAHLGLAETAAGYTAGNFSTPHSGSRFPAFWGPNFDWIPDQDHGCVAMIAFESMLLQTAGRQIILFPAWPKQWDVEFRLHAPHATVIEGVYRKGKLEQVRVTPNERRRDLVIKEPQP